MEIVNLTHNDDVTAIAKKCNVNFKSLAWSVSQLMKKRVLIMTDTIDGALQQMVDTVIPNEVSSQIAALDVPGLVSTAIANADIPGLVSTAITNADIPDQVANAVDEALRVETTTTLNDFFTEDGCTVTACQAMKWGDMAFIRFSYRLNSALTVPSNGDITDVTLGTLKIGWRPIDMTNVILDQTRILVGDVDNSGAIKARSANSRGTSYTIDANAVLYASMMLMLGIQ